MYINLSVHEREKNQQWDIRNIELTSPGKMDFVNKQKGLVEWLK
jgi:hypothetical protein